jgi:hypothetical protein
MIALCNQQDRQCTYKRNIEARSRNHGCRGKVIRVTYSECVCSLSYLAFNAHAPYYVICGLSGSNIFFHIISWTARCWEKKTLFNMKCVLIFSTKFFWNISHSTKNSALYYHEILSWMYVGLHVKYLLYLSDFNETWIFSIDFCNILKHQM